MNMNPTLLLPGGPILIFVWISWLITRHSYGLKEAFTRIAYLLSDGLLLASWFMSFSLEASVERLF